MERGASALQEPPKTHDSLPGTFCVCPCEREQGAEERLQGKCGKLQQLQLLGSRAGDEIESI